MPSREFSLPAEVAVLGPVEADVSPGWGTFWMSFGRGALLLFLGGSGVVLGFHTEHMRPKNSEPDPALALGLRIVVWGVGAPMCLGAGGAFLLVALRCLGERMLILRSGLARWERGHWVAYRLDEIEEL